MSKAKIWKLGGYELSLTTTDNAVEQQMPLNWDIVRSLRTLAKSNRNYLDCWTPPRQIGKIGFLGFR